MDGQGIGRQAPKSGIRADFIPSDRYGPEALAREKESVWPKVWQMACRLEEIPRVGDFITYEIFDESILVVRTAPDTISAFYNVCQHRGRRLRDEARGHIGKTFRCRFHGWQWNLDGTLAYVHAREDWESCPAFKDSDLGLKAVQVDTWGGWAWINQDPAAAPLKGYLGVVPSKLDPFEPESMRRLWWKTIIAPVNWKIVAEAFNEGYHSFATHISGINYRNLRQPTATHGKHGSFSSAMEGFTDYKTPGGEWKTPETLQEFLYVNDAHLYNTLHALTLEPGLAASKRLLDLPAETPPEEIIGILHAYHREELEKRGVQWPANLNLQTWVDAGSDWHIFPNSIVLPSIDGALWYRVRPNGDDSNSCIFDIWSFGRFAAGTEPVVEREIFEGFEAFKGQCPFLEEDFANMQAVNRGTKSRGFVGARTNPLQESTIWNFHRVLESYESGDPIP